MIAAPAVAGEPPFTTPAKTRVRVVMVDIAASQASLDAEECRQNRLSDDEIARASQLASSDRGRADQWRASRIATRMIFETVIGCDLGRRPLHREAGGKPHLPDSTSLAPWAISMSDCDGVALVAMTDAASVGVDIEGFGRALKLSQERRQKIVAAAARLGGALAGQSPAGIDVVNDDDVLRAWVRLEAVAKANGAGIGRVLTANGIVGGEPHREADAATRAAIASLDVRDLLLPAIPFFPHCGTDGGIPRHFAAAIAAPSLPAEIHVTVFPADAGAWSEAALPVAL